MKPRILATVSATAMLVVSAANAQPLDVYASGLLHQPLGSAQLDPVSDRTLTVRNIGSSGQDGVEIKYRSAWGGRANGDYSALATAGSELQVMATSSTGGVVCVHTLSGTGNDVVHHTVDFSGMNAVELLTTTYDTNGLVLSEVITTGPIIVIDAFINCDDPCYPVWMWLNWNGVGMMGWGCVCAGTGGNDWNPPMERTIQPILPGGVPGSSAVESLFVTGTNVPEMTVTNVALETFDVATWGLGQAHISELCPIPPCDPIDLSVEVSNIGSSGQDGVALELASHGVVTAEVTTSEPPGGHTVAAWKHKGYTGHVTLMKREMAPHPGTTDIDLSIDFSGIGAAEYDVTLYDSSDLPLGTYRLLNGLAFSISPCPVGSVWVNRWPPKFSGCEFIVDPTGFAMGPITGVTAMSFDPVDPTSPVGQPSFFEVTGSDVPGSIMISDVQVTTADPADENCDGTVDFFDIDPFLLALFNPAGYAAQYPGCGNGDVNGNGTTDFFDIDPFLTCLFSGCP